MRGKGTVKMIGKEGEVKSQGLDIVQGAEEQPFS